MAHGVLAHSVGRFFAQSAHCRRRGFASYRRVQVRAKSADSGRAVRRKIPRKFFRRAIPCLTLGAHSAPCHADGAEPSMRTVSLRLPASRCEFALCTHYGSCQRILCRSWHGCLVRARGAFPGPKFRCGSERTVDRHRTGAAIFGAGRTVSHGLAMAPLPVLAECQRWTLSHGGSSLAPAPRPTLDAQRRPRMDPAHRGPITDYGPSLHTRKLPPRGARHRMRSHKTHCQGSDLERRLSANADHRTLGLWAQPELVCQGTVTLRVIPPQLTPSP
jgi:hypothetical protein